MKNKKQSQLFFHNTIKRNEDLMRRYELADPVRWSKLKADLEKTFKNNFD